MSKIIKMSIINVLIKNKLNFIISSLDGPKKLMVLCKNIVVFNSDSDNYFYFNNYTVFLQKIKH